MKIFKKSEPYIILPRSNGIDPMTESFYGMVIMLNFQSQFYAPSELTPLQEIGCLIRISTYRTFFEGTAQFRLSNGQCLTI